MTLSDTDTILIKIAEFPMKVCFETISAETCHRLVCRRFTTAGFRHPFHYHPEIEITYIEKGRGTRVIGGHLGRFEPGDLVLIGANVPHVYRRDADFLGSAISEVMHIHPILLSALAESIPDLRRLVGVGCGVSFDRKTATQAERILRRARETQAELERWQWFFELAHILTTSCDHLTLGGATDYRPVRAARSHRMDRVCQFVVEHFAEDLRQRDLATRAHMSPEHFSREFLRATRRTFTEFLRDLRMGHARRLLLETDRTIVDLALECGFTNLSNFNRQFLRKEGCTPREFRRRGNAL